MSGPSFFGALSNFRGRLLADQQAVAIHDYRHQAIVSRKVTAARWLAQGAWRLADWNVTFLSDDLYCQQPFCEQVRARG
ncbi:hypothetical protein [Aromatoleum anaerobium]|uniref:Transposase n=1 Tax=Aromatoleum anaerobium TaxID=182180 RepID=A0ABX1PQ58_9RHOO|nr:hypothetical protein [Aromatoleum anaerobium]MCK0505529.1 hypothetical protein [Aromatoleum anaerobium]